MYIKKFIRNLLKESVFVNISGSSVKLIGLAWAFGIIGSFIDIYLSSELSKHIEADNVSFLIALFTVRTCITLASNYTVLKFSLSTEIDLKCKSFLLEDKNRDNFFKLISFNTAHMALTGILRIVIELTTLFILSAYIAYVNYKIFVISFSYGILLLFLFLFLMRFSKNVRQRAAVEQEIFLNKGGDLVQLSDRVLQIGALTFFFKRMRALSENYKKNIINSLFLAQSFKPFFELLVLLFAIYLYNENNLIGPIIYIYYRIGNGLLIIANSMPLVDHYIKQYNSHSNNKS